MPSKADTNAKDSDDARKLVQENLKEQTRIDRHEDDVVACHIRLGSRLKKLRSLANGTWGRQLADLGMAPRVASRYLRIATHWPDATGLNESDLRRLPADLLKLEWLCRVPTTQLGALLDDLDCRKETRSKVIAAVREALGEERPKRATPDVGKYVQRLFNRLTSTLENLDEKFPEQEQQNQARKLLVARLQQLQDSLSRGLPSSMQAPPEQEVVAASTTERPTDCGSSVHLLP